MAAGILFSSEVSLSWWWGVILIAVSIAICLIVLYKSDNPIKAFKAGKWHVAWVILLFSGIGVIDEYSNRPLTIEEASKGDPPKMVYGEIINILPKTYGDKMEVAIASTNGAKIHIRTGATSFSNGDIISFPYHRVKPIDCDSGAVVSSVATMLRSHGVFYTAYIPKKFISLEGRVLSFRVRCESLRQKIEIALEKSHLQKETSDFIKAILMGDKNGLDEQTRLTFANGGIAHILALSGLHMGILAVMIIWMLWPFRAVGKYKWGYALAILLLWLYVSVTGMSYSSVRACIMITFAFIAIIVERRNAVGHALCLSCLLILLVSPSSLFDAGFQLSVVCVASLVAFASPLNPIRHRHHPFLFRISEALLATIVATMASWVLISYYFGQVPLMFLPTNLLLLPIIPFYLALSVVFTISLYIGFEPDIFVSVLDLGYDILIMAADRLSYGTNYVIDYQISAYGVVGWMLMLSLSAVALYHKR